MKKWIKNFYEFWKFIIICFYKDQCLLRASALAFTTLLAMVPLVMIILSILSFFPFFDQASLNLQHFVFQNFLPNSGLTIEKYIHQFQQDAHHLPIWSILFLLVTAMFLMTEIESNLNAILRLKREKKRHVSLSILIHWIILTLGPVFICASVFLTSYLKYFSWLHLELYLEFWFYFLPFGCAFLAFVFLYLVVPGFRVRFSDALIGGLVSAVLFEISKYVFGFYLYYFPTYSLLYGALAVIPIFLLWVFISWSLFLLGAEVMKSRIYFRTQKLDNSKP